MVIECEPVPDEAKMWHDEKEKIVLQNVKDTEKNALEAENEALKKENAALKAELDDERKKSKNMKTYFEEGIRRYK